MASEGTVTLDGKTYKIVAGDMVFYNGGGLPSDDAMPAMVVEVFGDGQLTVSVYSQRVWHFRERVLHETNQRLQDNKQLAFKFGSWRFRETPPKNREVVLTPKVEPAPVETDAKSKQPAGKA